MWFGGKGDTNRTLRVDSVRKRCVGKLAESFRFLFFFSSSIGNFICALLVGNGCTGTSLSFAVCTLYNIFEQEDTPLFRDFYEILWKFDPMSFVQKFVLLLGA